MEPTPELRKRYSKALANAGLLHVIIGVGRIVSVDHVQYFQSICRLRSFGQVGLQDAELHRLQQEEDALRRNQEKRYYATFLVLYGVLLGMYSAFSSWQLQKWAVAIETYRISCYVFFTTLEEFGRPFEVAGDEIQDVDPIANGWCARQIWKLIGIVGLLGHICGLHGGSL